MRAEHRQALVGALCTTLGDANVLTDPELVTGYATDWMGRAGPLPVAVARPGDTAEVAAVLRACAKAGVTVVPQCGNTGLVGGSVPRGALQVVLSTRRLRTLGPVDVAQAAVTVGAGAVLADVQAAAAPHGLAVGVDLAARGSATIGGMVATNAGGIHVVAHGPMRQQVRGLEAVLADGTVLSRLDGPVKDNAGLDLAQLLTGSEGTLAIITAVTLRLVPVPAERTVVLVGCRDVADAVALLAGCRTAGRLRAVELMTARGLALVAAHLQRPVPFPPAVHAAVLVERDGDDPSPLVDAIDDRPAVVAQDAADARGLWHLREAHTEAIAATGLPLLKLDVALPLTRLAGFVEWLATLGGDPVVFGHLAEGNLHVNVLDHPGGANEDDPADAILRRVAAEGGSIAAEHGVGVDKVRWLPLTRGAGELTAMRRIKSALDPAGLLNPGVMLPVPSGPPDP